MDRIKEKKTGLIFDVEFVVNQYTIFGLFYVDNCHYRTGDIVCATGKVFKPDEVEFVEHIKEQKIVQGV